MKTKSDLKQLSKNELIALLLSASSESTTSNPAPSIIQIERDTYKAERDDYKEKLDRSYAERDKLRAIIAKLQRSASRSFISKLTSVPTIRQNSCCPRCAPDSEDWTHW